MRRKRWHFGEMLSIGAWAIALATGIVFGVRFESKPGTLGSAADPWPADSGIRRSLERPTLLLFAHPFCPCTRATLAELERALARCGDRIDTQVVISWEGAAVPDDEVGIEPTVRAVPGVKVVMDPGAREARRFGAATSGEALLYETSGRLAFHGGITAARGHEGDNGGREALVDCVLHDRPASSPLASSPVFGCPLLTPGCADRAAAKLQPSGGISR